MFAKTLRLIWIDALVTLMRGVMVIVRFVSGDRFSDKLEEGQSLSIEWELQRQPLLRQARRLMSRVCLLIFIAIVTAEAVATPFSDVIKSQFNTDKYPIIVSEVAIGALILACIALYIAIINWHEQ